jgi:hypothetical protein
MRASGRARVIAMGAIVSCVFLGGAIARADELDDRMRAEMDAINRQAPMMVDSTTRLDNAVYHDRIFVYHYTLLNHASTDFSPQQKKKASRLTKDQVVGRACTGSALADTIAAGITFKYVNFGNDNQLVSEATVQKKDCEVLLPSSPPLAAARMRTQEPEPTKSPDVTGGSCSIGDDIWCDDGYRESTLAEREACQQHGGKWRDSSCPNEGRVSTCAWKSGSFTHSYARVTLIQAKGACKNGVFALANAQKETWASASTKRAVAPGVAVRVISKGASYSDVMDALGGFPAEKRPYGDYLDATYKSAELLAYPDAGGACLLTFAKGLLSSCSGCDPRRFHCDAN